MSEVTRNRYVSSSEGSTPAGRVNRQGSGVGVDQILQWSIEGRIFCASDADGDDTVAAIATWVATTPQLLLRVPTGTTAVPLLVLADNQGTNGATGNFVMMYDRVDRFSSGGTAETVTPFRTDKPVAALCTVYSTVTAAAATEARTFFSQQYETSDGTALGAAHMEWTATKFPPPILVGPAAMLVWFNDDAGTPGFVWSLQWAEFPTGELT